MGVPEVFCAPDTVAVYAVLGANEVLGVKVAIVLPPVKVTEPGTAFPPASFSVNVTVLGTTGCENVADGAAETGTLVDPSVGVAPVTVGAAVGVTALDGDEAGPVPIALVAVTVKV
jgi:hypothetical protein